MCVSLSKVETCHQPLELQHGVNVSGTSGRVTATECWPIGGTAAVGLQGGLLRNSSAQTWPVTTSSLWWLDGTWDFPKWAERIYKTVCTCWVHTCIHSPKGICMWLPFSRRESIGFMNICCGPGNIPHTGRHVRVGKSCSGDPRHASSWNAGDLHHLTCQGPLGKLLCVSQC